MAHNFPHVLARSKSEANAAAIVVTLPPGSSDGDLIIISLGSDLSGTDRWTQTSGTTGWTELFDLEGAAIWWKQIGVSEANPSFDHASGSNQLVAVAQRITAHADPAVDPPEVTTATGTSAVPDNPSHTPSTGQDFYLLIAGFATNEVVETHTLPSQNHDLNEKSAGSSGNEATVVTAERDRFFEASDPGGFGIDISTAWIAWTLSVRKSLGMPTTISGVDLLATSTQGRSKPYTSSAGKQYGVFRDGTTNTDLDIYKAVSSPFTAFTQVASLTLNASGVLLGWGTFQVGDDIHIATQDNNEAILYHVFSMASDTFTTSNEAVTSAVGTNVDDEKCVSIALETGLDIIIAYQGASDLDMGAKERVDYAFKTGGSWTVDQPLDAGGTVNYFLGGIIRGEANKFHVTFVDLTNRDAKHRSIQDVDGTPTAVEDFNDDNLLSAIEFQIGLPTYHQDFGVEHITCQYANGAAFIKSAAIRDDGSPLTPQLVTGAVRGTGKVLAVAGFVSDLIPKEDGDLTDHIVFAKADQDIFANRSIDGSSWSLETEELDAITCSLLTANVYTRFGIVRLAYFYDDAGTILYNEKDLRGVMPTFAKARLPQQNYFVGPFKI